MDLNPSSWKLYVDDFPLFGSSLAHLEPELQLFPKKYQFFGGFPKEGTVVVLSSLTQLRRLEEGDQSGNQPVLIFKTGFTHNHETERHL